MERTIDVGSPFDKVLDDVATTGDRYIVERDGEAIAAVVPMHVYAAWTRDREAFFDRLEATARRVNMDEDDAMALALEAQRAVRSPRWAEG